MDTDIRIERLVEYAQMASSGVPLALTIEEVARLTGISRDCLAHWRCKGIGPRWVKYGRSVRYPVKDFLSYLELGELRAKEFPSVW